jgi:anti-anti-sigma factor
MAQETEDFLLDLVDRAQPPVVVLDLSQTDYFDSRFIETMVRAWNRIKRRDGRFAVCGLKPFCREVIQTTKLDTIWDVFATRDEAVAALEKDG